MDIIFIQFLIDLHRVLIPPGGKKGRSVLLSSSLSIMQKKATFLIWAGHPSWQTEVRAPLGTNRLWFNLGYQFDFSARLPIGQN